MSCLRTRQPTNLVRRMGTEWEGAAPATTASRLSPTIRLPASPKTVDLVLGIHGQAVFGSLYSPRLRALGRSPDGGMNPHRLEATERWSQSFCPRFETEEIQSGRD